MQVAAQLLDTLVGEVPVVVPPGELLLDEAARVQGLQRLDDVQIGDRLQLGVLLGVEVLLGHDYTLLEEVFVDGDTMGLWHEHAAQTKK